MPNLILEQLENLCKDTRNMSPTALNERFEEFQLIVKSLDEMDESTDIESKGFNEIIQIATKLFEDKTNPWRFLIAEYIIFQLYNKNIVSGLPVTQSPLKECIEWADKIIKADEPDTSNNVMLRIERCLWLAALLQRRQDLAGVQKYTAIAKELAFSSPYAKYAIVSDTLHTIVGIYDAMLPPDAKMSDPITQKLLAALDDEIEFHRNVPLSKRHMETYVTPKHGLLELKKIMLEEKYAQELLLFPNFLREKQRKAVYSSERAYESALKAYNHGERSQKLAKQFMDYAQWKARKETHVSGSRRKNAMAMANECLGEDNAARINQYKRELSKLLQSKKVLNQEEPPIKIWEHSEQWDAEKTLVQAMSFLGETLYKLGAIDAAAKQFLDVVDLNSRYDYYTSLKEYLQRPDIQKAIKELRPDFYKDIGDTSKPNEQKSEVDSPKSSSVVSLLVKNSGFMQNPSSLEISNPPSSSEKETQAIQSRAGK